MSNKITEKYFNQENFAKREKSATEKITGKTDFIIEKEIFRGKIYDDDKVGSLIYKGKWQGTTAVLKIQGLKPAIEESAIIEKFNAQNTSNKIRLPKIYANSNWNQKDGWGYLIMEYIDAQRIYQPPLATPEQRREFCALYQEYKTKCLKKPFFAQESQEKSSLVYTAQRISHWARIAQMKNQLTEIEVKNIEKFFIVAGLNFPSIKMEFMHGHFTYDDIFKISNQEYVLMSNLFWSYRPEYYDATFHLWAGLKSLSVDECSFKQIQQYINQWRDEYKKIPQIKCDTDFDRKFFLLLAERSLGTVLVDLQSQNYKNRREKNIAYLTKLFRDLFDYCLMIIEK